MSVYFPKRYEFGILASRILTENCLVVWHLTSIPSVSLVALLAIFARNSETARRGFMQLMRRVRNLSRSDSEFVRNGLRTHRRYCVPPDPRLEGCFGVSDNIVRAG
jgi:hypothetical protein